jgi:hypothetical protein
MIESGEDPDTVRQQRVGGVLACPRYLCIALGPVLASA